MAVTARAVRGGLDVSGLPYSPELREVLTRATAPDRDRRYVPAELLTALCATPEGPGPAGLGR